MKRPESLDRAQSFVEAVTPGPWDDITHQGRRYDIVSPIRTIAVLDSEYTVPGDELIPISERHNAANADFIVFARNHLAEIVAYALEQGKEHEAWKDAACKLSERLSDAEARVAELTAALEALREDHTLAEDALVTVKDDLLTVIRGGKRDLGKAHSRVDDALQTLFNRARR